MSDTPDAAQISADDLQEIEQANASGLTAGRVRPRPLAPAQQLGPLGRGFEEAGYSAVAPGWPDDPETVAEANGAPEVFARKSHRRHRRPLRGRHPPARPRSRRRRPLLRRPADADPRRPRARRRVGRHRPRAVPRRAAAADLGAALGVAGAGQPGQPPPRRPAHLRPVPLRVRQRGRRGRGQELYETYAVPALGRADLPGRGRQPQPVDRGQGRHQQPRPRPAADHLRRARPHRAVGDRQRVLQASRSATRA